MTDKKRKHYANLLDGARKVIGADLLVILPVFVDELSNDSGFTQVEILGTNQELLSFANELAKLISLGIEEVANKYPDQFTVRKTTNKTLN